jgi:hypothetical protein
METGDEMETLEQYFARPDTPMGGSPVGVLMVKILAKNPGMDYEGAYIEARLLLSQAAGYKHWQMPTVLSPAEREAKMAQFKARMAAVDAKDAQDTQNTA